MTVSKREETYAFVVDFLDDNGFPPSTNEIAAHFKITRVAALFRLRTLERHGQIARVPGVARGIRIVERMRRVG